MKSVTSVLILSLCAFALVDFTVTQAFASIYLVNKLMFKTYFKPTILTLLGFHGITLTLALDFIRFYNRLDKDNLEY